MRKLIAFSLIVIHLCPLASLANGQPVGTQFYINPVSGQGYNLFYYDGYALRDEKWRFHPRTGHPVYARRNAIHHPGGLNTFYVVDAISDATHTRTHQYTWPHSDIDRLLASPVQEPQLYATEDNNNNNNPEMYQPNLSEDPYRDADDRTRTNDAATEALEPPQNDFNDIFNSPNIGSNNVETSTAAAPPPETTTRRRIEGLPTSEEDYQDINEDGVDHKIDPSVLKSLLG